MLLWRWREGGLRRGYPLSRVVFDRLRFFQVLPNEVSAWRSTDIGLLRQRFVLRWEPISPSKSEHVESSANLGPLPSLQCYCSSRRITL